MDDLFSHTHETTRANTAIYSSQKERLSVNAWLILFALLEGQRLSAIQFTQGILIDGLHFPHTMLEYRRRCTEIKAAGIELMFEIDRNGMKTHWIPAFKITEYKAKYESYRQTLLDKLNKH